MIIMPDTSYWLLDGVPTLCTDLIHWTHWFFCHQGPACSWCSIPMVGWRSSKPIISRSQRSHDNTCDWVLANQPRYFGWFWVTLFRKWQLEGKWFKSAMCQYVEGWWKSSRYIPTIYGCHDVLEQGQHRIPLQKVKTFSSTSATMARYDQTKNGQQSTQSQGFIREEFICVGSQQKWRYIDIHSSYMLV
jgi:hypothetical protein